MTARHEERTDLGDRLKMERLAKGMSITEVAEKSGLSKAYISQLEAGNQTNPSLEALRKIARALGITVGRLIGGEAARASTVPQALTDPSLEAFVEDRRRQGKPIPEPDLQLLLALQWRGGRAKRTKEDWAFIYDAIRRMWDKPGGSRG